MYDEQHIICYLLMALCGAFGGLLGGIKDGQAKIPKYIKCTQSNKNSYIELGILKDLMFGIAGGFVLILLIPSIPSIENNKDEWAILKILSIALIGGYGGRSVIQRALDEKEISKIARNETAQILDEQTAKDTALRNKVAEAQGILFQIVNHKIEKNSKYTNKQIEDMLRDLPADSLVTGYNMGEAERDRLVGDLLAGKDEKETKTKLTNLLPLFEAIINLESETEQNKEYIHCHYASLAYLYKDGIEPDWNKALEYINKSIKSYRDANPTYLMRIIYRFNLFVCHINVIPFSENGFDTNNNHHNEALKLFEEFQEEGAEIMSMVVTSQEIIAPKLHQWVSLYECSKISSYIFRHRKLPEPDLAIWKRFLKENKCYELDNLSKSNDAA